MGYLLAVELRAHLPEDLALAYHLAINHFPPVPLIFLPVVREALRLAREGDYATKLELPTGDRLSVRAIVDELHLEAFVEEAGA